VCDIGAAEFINHVVPLEVFFKQPEASSWFGYASSHPRGLTLRRSL
jgi:hypothetical protein